MTDAVERLTQRIMERMGPLVGSPEYLADPIKRARSEARQRDAARSYATMALQEVAAAGLLPTGTVGGWSYDMDAAPRGRASPSIVAVPVRDGGEPVVGEAFYQISDDFPNETGWYWAGQTPGDYYADLIINTNCGPPFAWQPLPAAPTPPQEPMEGDPLDPVQRRPQ